MTLKKYQQIKLVIVVVTTIILAIFASIFTLRLFSGEDRWVCQKGEWVQHGHPDFPAPTIPCK